MTTNKTYKEDVIDCLCSIMRVSTGDLKYKEKMSIIDDFRKKCEREHIEEEYIKELKRIDTELGREEFVRILVCLENKDEEEFNRRIKSLLNKENE